MRGREPLVTCDSCGRSVPRSKGIKYEKTIRFGTDPGSANVVKFLSKRSVYYCISCAKHRGIFERKKEEAAREAARHAERRF